MTGLTIFSLFSDFTCSSSNKYASDPIDLTNHDLDHDHAHDGKENSMRIFMHQNSIALCDRRVRDEISSTISAERDPSKQQLVPRTTLAPAASPTMQKTLHKLGMVHDDEGKEQVYIESRDDTICTVASFVDEDLIVAHPSRTDDELREESIEIINIAYIHE